MFTIEKQDQCIEFFLSLREGTPAHQFKMLEALSSTSKSTTESLRKDLLSVNYDVLSGDLTQYSEKYRIGTLMTTNAHEEQLDSTAISNAPHSFKHRIVLFFQSNLRINTKRPSKRCDNMR